MSKCESSIYKSIPNMRFEYRVGDMADVQRKMPDGTWRNIKPFMSRRNKRMYITLWFSETVRKPIPLVRLMDDLFFDSYAKKNNMNITHKNGIKTDCSIYNLMFIPREEFGKHNPNIVKRVVKIDIDGNRVAYYNSCKEAASKNFISTTSVYNRVNNKVKHPFRLDGFNYQFVEDE